MARSRSKTRKIFVAVLLACVATVVSACGSSKPSSTASATSPAGAANLKVASSSYGKILVTSSGRTLYMLTADTSKSLACTGSCLSIWHPLTASQPVAGGELKSTLLGTVARGKSEKQVTYNGHPLYTYQGDTKSGEASGEGLKSFGGTWYVLNPSGEPVTSTSTNSSSSSSSSSSAYSY